MRALVYTAALLFVLAFGLLTVLYIRSSGLTAVGILGIIVLVVVGVGVVGALLHPPDR